ncbi:MAG: IS3 family transposase, partial [Anaerolineaceae bacterium]|nr:IS3 family transposase [Anaerolineaceae bacterium]
GRPLDNAPMESFYKTLKRELIYSSRYQDLVQARQSLFEYIEVYYNRNEVLPFIGHEVKQ